MIEHDVKLNNWDIIVLKTFLNIEINRRFSHNENLSEQQKNDYEKLTGLRNKLRSI